MSIFEIIIVSIVGILSTSALIISMYLWIDFELSNKKNIEKPYITKDIDIMDDIDIVEVRRLYDKVANLKMEDEIDIIWSK